jgi:hypothetical protein
MTLKIFVNLTMTLKIFINLIATLKMRFHCCCRSSGAMFISVYIYDVNNIKGDYDVTFSR